MILKTRLHLLWFLLATFLLVPATCSLAARVQFFDIAIAIQEEEENEFADEEELEDDEEFEDDAEFMDNPWQVDERKVFAAKKFQLTNQFALKVQQIESICGELDKKQKLKLKIASKGATEKAVNKFVKDWKQQMRQFGGFQNQGDDDDDDKKKKKRKKKKKQFVFKNVDEIDANVMQMLDNSFFGIIVNSEPTDVELWNRTVKQVLNAEQQKKLDSRLKKLSLARRNARANSFITDMSQRLALSDEQIDAFDSLVRPAFLKKDITVNWQYEAMATLYFGSKFDKKKMMELLSEEQYLLLQFAVKPAENYAGMFGDNVVVGRMAVIADDPVIGFLDDVVDAVEGFTDLLENPFEGVFEW